MGRDRWSAVGLALLALGYLLAARRYPLDTLATPGPGIFPAVAGLALLLVAIWQLAMTGRVGAMRISNRPPTDRAGLADPAPTIPTTARPLVLCVVLVLYAAALPRVGFVVSSFVLVVVASRLMGLAGWWRPAALALGIAAASHVVFARWLGVPLP